MVKTKRMNDLLKMLDSDDIDLRVTAIQVLGEIGDADVIKLLRERLALANKETYALIVAVGKLKKRLGVK